MPFADKEKEKKYRAEYGRCKKHRLYDWKRSGIKIHNNDEVFNRYVNTNYCDFCNVELEEGNRKTNRKCLEHDHTSGYVRGISCNKCNFALKAVDNKRHKLLLEIHRYYFKNNI